MVHGAAHSSWRPVAMRQGSGVQLPLLLLLVCLAGASPVVSAALHSTQAGVNGSSVVSSPPELRAALADPSVSRVYVSSHSCLVLGPDSFAPPVDVARPVTLIGASTDACLDWNYTASKLISVLPGGALTIDSLTLKHFHPSNVPLPLNEDTNMLPLAALNIAPNGASLVVAHCIFHIVQPVATLAAHMPLWMHASQMLKDASRPCGFGGRVCGTGSANSSSSMYASEDSPNSDASTGPSDAMLELNTSKVWRSNYTTTYYGGNSSSTILDSLVVVDPQACFGHNGDSFAYDSSSLARLLRNNATESILLFQNITLDGFVFRFTRRLVVARPLRITACPGVMLHLNEIREAVEVRAGGSMLFTGGMTIAGSRPIPRYGWPNNNPLLLSVLSLHAGASVAVVNATIITQEPASKLQQMLLQYPAAQQPAIAAGGPTAMRSPGSFSVMSWSVSPGDWEADSAEAADALDAAAVQTLANAKWTFENVLVEQQALPCFTSGSPVQVDSSEEMLAALIHPNVHLIEVTNNIQLDPLKWSQQMDDNGHNAASIDITRPVEVRACHPQAQQGKRYTIDCALIGPVLSVVGPSGHMRFSGDLNLTRSSALAGRDGMWWLLSPIAQSNGATLEFANVVIHGTEATALHDGSSALWQSSTPSVPGALSIAGTALPNFSLAQGRGLISNPSAKMLQPAPLEWMNISYHSVYLGRYLFDGSLYVSMLSPNATLNGTSYIFDDTIVEWWPEDAAQPQGMPASTIVAIVLVVVLVPLLAALAGGLLLLQRRRKRALALQAKHDEETQLTGRAGLARPMDSAHAQHQAESPATRTGHGKGTTTGALLPMVAAARAGADGSSSRADGSQQLKAPAVKLHAELIEEARRSLAADRGVALGGGLGKPEEVVLEAVLGEGTFGKVYKGHWKGTLVAIKTMAFPATMSGKEKREKMAIMETAISLSSSLSHPNVVQTYTYYLTPVLAVSDSTADAAKDAAMHGTASAGAGPGTDKRSRAVVGDDGGVRSSAHVNGDVMGKAVGAGGGQQAQEAAADASGSGIDDTVGMSGAEGSVSEEVAAWEVRLVLEYCDRGSLRDYISKGGHFALPQPPQQQHQHLQQQPQAASDSSRHGSLASRNMCQVLDTAMDIAKAMVHLHSENIIHSDLKARNILLKSSGGDSRGFIAKVADFGLSLRIDPDATHVDNVYQGTMTHMAPEVLLHGKISRASDVYAYGILLWELITGGHAYRGVPRAVLGHEVTKRHLRPAFPRDTPFDYQLLACRCWESDLSIRPTFEEILLELKRMRQQRQDPMQQHHSHLRPQGWPGVNAHGPQAWAAAVRTGRLGPIAGVGAASGQHVSTLSEAPRSVPMGHVSGPGAQELPLHPLQQGQAHTASSADVHQGPAPDELSATSDTRRSTYLTGPISSSTSSLMGSLLDDDELYNDAGYSHDHESRGPLGTEPAEHATATATVVSGQHVQRDVD